MADRRTASGAQEEGSGIRATARIMPAVVRRELRTKSRTTPFLIWISFLLSLAITRAWVILFRSVGRGDTSDVTFEVGRNVIVGGYHIHHIATGIALLAIAGWLTLHYKGRQIARTAAVMYGIGLGFIVDELGFVVGGITPYRDDGEVFIVAVILGALLMSAVFAPRFWRAVREDVQSIARVVADVPQLRRPKEGVPRETVDEALEHAWGPPPAANDPDVDPEAREPPVARHGHRRTDSRTDDAAEAGPEGDVLPHSSVASDRPDRVVTAAMVRWAYHPKRDARVGHGAREEVDEGDPFRDPALTLADYRQHQSTRTYVFESLLGKLVEVLVVIILVGLLLGIAKLVISLFDVLIGVSVARLMHPILVGVLTLLIGIQLMRAMVEYLRHARLMLPFLVDAGILLGLREIADELFRARPDPVLVGVVGGLLVALGGLRVILVRSMKDMQIHAQEQRRAAEPEAEAEPGARGEGTGDDPPPHSRH